MEVEDLGKVEGDRLVEEVRDRAKTKSRLKMKSKVTTLD